MLISTGPQRNGIYFLDTDPKLFEHLLRSMRRPPNFSLFWSRHGGFDYDLYPHLQAEAEAMRDVALWWYYTRNYRGLGTFMFQTDQRAPQLEEQGEI